MAGVISFHQFIARKKNEEIVQLLYVLLVFPTRVFPNAIPIFWLFSITRDPFFQPINLNILKIWNCCYTQIFVILKTLVEGACNGQISTFNFQLLS